MTPLLPIHITAGLVSIAGGMVALYVAKGSDLHRKSGWVFAIAMWAMTVSAVVMATFIFPNKNNVVGGMLTFYLVGTGLLAVLRPVEQSRGWLTGFMLLAMTTSVCAFAFGMEILSGDRMRWMALPLFLFGTIGSLAAIGDARVLRAGRIEGEKRLKRHLWRMSLAMWIATASFFLGQAKFFPEPLRHASGLRTLPVLWVLAVMFYWLFRLRARRHQSPPLPHATPAAE
jgi:uncharacterized membrane protein